jgi:hypothetical protein
MKTTTEELLKEIRELKAELQQMRSIVNSLVNIVMEMEGLDEDVWGLLPDHLLDNFDMYN